MAMMTIRDGPNPPSEARRLSGINLQRSFGKKKNCNVCGGWLVKRHPAGFWYASSDYIGMDTCYTCWIEECLTTNCLGCKRGNYPDCKWIDLKKSYQEEDK